MKENNDQDISRRVWAKLTNHKCFDSKKKETSFSPKTSIEPIYGSTAFRCSCGQRWEYMKTKPVGSYRKKPRWIRKWVKVND